MNTETYIKNTITPAIESNRSKATGFMNSHNILSITGIALCASVAVVLAVGASIGINLGLLIASVSCAGVSCAVLLTDRIYDFERKSIEANYKANALTKEMDLFRMHAGIYEVEDDALFVERCEEIMNR